MLLLRSRLPMIHRGPQFSILPQAHHIRTYASKRGPTEYSDEDLSAARKWLADLNADTVPRSLSEITFSRSSGPGGQNVNKVSSKATLRLPTSSLLPLLPAIFRPAILSSRYYAPKSDALIIQADDARKQVDNANACFRRLHNLLLEIGRETVPNETAPGQAERVEKLQKAEAAGRRKMKEKQSSKKSARRGGRGED